MDDHTDAFSDEEEDLTWLVDREIKVMSELDHPHIVHLDEVYEDKDTACFVMELAKGGEVFDRLIEKEYFDEVSASNLVVQVLSGKISNCFFTKYKCKIKITRLLCLFTIMNRQFFSRSPHA